MIKTIQNIFKVPDLRKKILFTLMMILVYRIGAHIPVPFIHPGELADRWTSMFGSTGMLGLIDMFSGGAFRRMSIFALGIMPYISASIIIQLLMVVWPRLEKIAKEGEVGRKKINQYTRYGTVGLAGFQAFGASLLLMQWGLSAIPTAPVLFVTIGIISMTTGTTFLMWMGEKISEKGIGNGISLVIALGILSSYPLDAAQALTATVGEAKSIAPIWLPIIVLTFVAVSVAIIFIQEGARKIPIQHAKRVVGRRMVSGGTTYLPLKVNTAGVIPVIFSAAILSFPGILLSWLGGGQTGSTGFFGMMQEMFNPRSIYNPYDWLHIEKGGIFLLLKVVTLYTVLYTILTVFFCFFYTAITFNPNDTAENLKKSGAFIPGRRPGKPTSDYIDFVLTRITLVGAIFLVTVALMPNVFNVGFNIPWAMTDFVGGTGLIIVIGVLLDTMKQVESHLLMRHYDGFRITDRWTRK